VTKPCVVEAVEFERFFTLKLVYGDVVGPVVINLRGAPDGAEEEAPLRRGRRRIPLGRANMRARSAPPARLPPWT